MTTNQEGKHTPEQPDFEFEAVTYANEWELGHWGDEQGKKLVDKSFRDGIKLSRAEQAWSLVASQSSELSRLKEKFADIEKGLMIQIGNMRIENAEIRDQRDYWKNCKEGSDDAARHIEAKLQHSLTEREQEVEKWREEADLRRKEGDDTIAQRDGLIAALKEEIGKMNQEHNILKLNYDRMDAAHSITIEAKDKEIERLKDSVNRKQIIAEDKMIEVERLKLERDNAYREGCETRNHEMEAKDKELADLRTSKSEWIESHGEVTSERDDLKHEAKTLRESNEKLTKALNMIMQLEPETHDEWGEAACFTQAQDIANVALGLTKSKPTE